MDFKKHHYLINNNAVFTALISSILFFIAVFFKSRAFCIGYIISIAYLLFINNIKKTNKNLLIGYIIIGIALMSLILIFKTDSSLGRLFIYKITFNIFKDCWYSGLGLGNFSSRYLYYQAEYFKNENFTIKELLLADDTQYAFNDYWQFILETGIKGLLFLTGCVMLIKFYVKKAVNHNLQKPKLLLFAITQLIAICTAALFTHVFERFAFQVIFLLAIFLVVMYSNTHRAKLPIIATLIFLSLITWQRWGNYLQNANNYRKLEEAKNLYQSGYILDALTGYKALYPFLLNDPAFVFEYANILSVSGHDNEAEIEYKHGISLQCSNIYYNKLAGCYYKNNKLKMAENAYKMAINMVPNRFIPRYKLYQFYTETRQTKLAYKTGLDILKLPVKIPSPEITIIKAELSKNLTYKSIN